MKAVEEGKKKRKTEQRHSEKIISRKGKWTEEKKNKWKKELFFCLVLVYIYMVYTYTLPCLFKVTWEYHLRLIEHV